MYSDFADRRPTTFYRTFFTKPWIWLCFFHRKCKNSPKENQIMHIEASWNSWRHYLIISECPRKVQKSGGHKEQSNKRRLNEKVSLLIPPIYRDKCPPPLVPHALSLMTKLNSFKSKVFRLRQPKLVIFIIKFMFSKKATKVNKIFTVSLTLHM